MILKKHELEASLHEEKKLIETGKLREENPLDLSESFERLCTAVRRGDLKVCQEAINDGANINGRDRFDYTPLILASLCGRFEIVQFLLESGALCERDTFQGERCLYNALNDSIRNLLLRYEYSKESDPLQPLAGHITSLLTRDSPATSDIVVAGADRSFNLHRFVLAARSPYFARKLAHAPDTAHWRLPLSLPPQSFEIAVRYLYLGELPADVSGPNSTGSSEDEILEGIDRISRQLEIPSLWEAVLEVNNRRLARQQRVAETERGRGQLEGWFRANVLANKVVVDSDRASSVRWDRTNTIFADILLRADEPEPEDGRSGAPSGTQTPSSDAAPAVGPLGMAEVAAALPQAQKRSSTLFPVHRAVLLRSEYFQAMFSSAFAEAHVGEHLRTVTVDCAPAVLEAVLAFLYAERADFGLALALDVLFAADVLLVDRLKTKAAQVISALGSGVLPEGGGRAAAASAAVTAEPEAADETDPLDPFAVLAAAYDLRVPRLEEFAARYLAYRLEAYADLPEFEAAVAKSAARIRDRQETDTIELVDDIRYYLSERFRLRFEGEGLEQLLSEDAADGDLVVAEADDGDIHGALAAGEFRTLDGELAGDEFASDAVNYRLLLAKIDAVLDKLQLDD